MTTRVSRPGNRAVATLLCALSLACGRGSAPVPSTELPSIPFEKYTLSNGLDVILSEDHRLPLVAIDVWYHVGPANEAAGRTGFAHLFEHMMFQGSKHVPGDSHFRLVESAGGTSLNGTTGFDRTNYFQTLPANQALNVHPEHVYHLVDTPRGLFVLAADLQEACLARFGLAGTTIAAAKGAALEGLAFRHPFYDRLAPVYLGEYVTLDTGTGIVHSAPAYGVEDFESCRRYGMRDDEMLNPVQGDGRYAASLPFFGGLSIWDANPKIVAKLREVGALFSEAPHVHSYMHCWRHKTPVILRATTQWFAGMDDVPGFAGRKPAETLRTTALAGVAATQFFPAWGQARLHGMIASRPDWTLSRQRQWGVPMPFFIDRETGALHPRTLELLEEVAKHVERGGIEAWQRLDPKALLGDEAARF